MALLSRLTITIGLILLVHAGYSAHEHTLSPTSAPLPHDITLETLIAVILVIFGLVAGQEKLQPISWRVWAGEIERRGGGGVGIGSVGKKGDAGAMMVDNPFRGLEDRVGFWDVRAKRKEFADWVRDQDTAGK